MIRIGTISELVSDYKHTVMCCNGMVDGYVLCISSQDYMHLY